MTTYEVCDMETANQVGAFQSEAEARAFLSEMLRLNGADTVKALSVAAMRHDDSGIVDQTLIIEGPDFVAELERHERSARPSGTT
jgi:hypothetical protein